MNIISLHSDHRHVSATRVVIFMVVSKRITKIVRGLNCGVISKQFTRNFVDIFVLTTKDCGMRHRNTHAITF